MMKSETPWDGNNEEAIVIVDEDRTPWSHQQCYVRLQTDRQMMCARSRKLSVSSASLGSRRTWPSNTLFTFLSSARISCMHPNQLGSHDQQRVQRFIGRSAAEPSLASHQPNANLEDAQHGVWLHGKWAPCNPPSTPMRQQPSAQPHTAQIAPPVIMFPAVMA